ncbi:hypothetical protein [Daejeonella sp. JGW-45]|uniref:hypothetical protein n=1 Tax=Daejeonella sp. JGW-45 TaxID=3034148 RepID=UPI0023ECF9DD|nr:hypothetical protein [Daejeonella sp. JGW-45]
MNKKTVKGSLRTISNEIPLSLEEKTDASRRTFIRTTGLIVASGVLGASASVSGMNEAGLRAEDMDQSKCIDYGKSFLCNTGKYNSARMWIESRTTITDTKSGKHVVYYQGASCKSENTFGEKDLFYSDNYDFLPVFGAGKVLVFRRHADKRGDRYRSVKKMEGMWGGNPVIYTPVPEVITELNTFEKIRDATAAGIPIVTQTELKNDETGLRAVIEAPCKTMNINHARKLYQVDTGPIVYPDLSKIYDEQIDSLSLAFIAFNQDHFADFVIEAPTPITKDGKMISTVYHYSKIVTIQATNRIFALGKV